MKYFPLIVIVIIVYKSKLEYCEESEPRRCRIDLSEPARAPLALPDICSREIIALEESLWHRL